MNTGGHQSTTSQQGSSAVPSHVKFGGCGQRECLGGNGNGGGLEGVHNHQPQCRMQPKRNKQTNNNVPNKGWWESCVGSIPLCHCGGSHWVTHNKLLLLLRNNSQWEWCTQCVLLLSNKCPTRSQQRNRQENQITTTTNKNVGKG